MDEEKQQKSAMTETKFLELKDIKEMTVLYLSGIPKQEIAKKFNVPMRTITGYLKRSPVKNLEVEKKNLEFYVARENARINNIKELLYDYTEQALKEANEQENKIYYLPKISAMLSEVDKMARLNRGESTENINNRTENINYDISEIMKQCKTPEEKKDFLLNQLQNKNNESK